MESGHDIYYQGNTVKSPNPGRKRKAKVISNTVGYIFNGKLMDRTPKVCAHSQCVWCDFPFGGQYMIICPRCRNCQYCGQYNEYYDKCSHCDNKLPDEIKPEITKLVANKNDVIS